MIVVTGAAGFIGSCMVEKLNNEGHTDLLLVDDFSHPEKRNNYADKKYAALIERSVFLEYFKTNYAKIDFVIHLGARTNTAEFDTALLHELNVSYTQQLFALCTQHNIGIIYASSAATYGLGEHGYDDDHSTVHQLVPLNPYGDSKQEVDEWVLAQAHKPYYWAGVKFFNVYGPNEYHKGRMASVIMHSYNQIKTTGEAKLFRSHNPNYSDGGQLRDFVYVLDVVNVLYHLMHYRKKSGLYNLGTGKAESFLTLATSVFKALNLEPNISYVDTPIDIREKYQYYTQANISKLRTANYLQPFYSLEQGTIHYVQQYLQHNKYM
jgi:ADP-L-glycero-D-manno-heptose 6-epimerase